MPRYPAKRAPYLYKRQSDKSPVQVTAEDKPLNFEALPRAQKLVVWVVDQCEWTVCPKRYTCGTQRTLDTLVKKGWLELPPWSCSEPSYWLTDAGIDAIQRHYALTEGEYTDLKT